MVKVKRSLLVLIKINEVNECDDLWMMFIAKWRLVIINFNGAENLWVTLTISRM